MATKKNGILTQKSVNECNTFLDNEYKDIRKKGYTVTVKHTGTWPMATIRKKATKKYPIGYMMQIDVSVKPGKKLIHIHIRESNKSKSRDYKYEGIDKFKTGFKRNVSNYLPNLHT